VQTAAFSSSMRNQADHDHEESFEEFTARYELFLEEMWVVERHQKNWSSGQQRRMGWSI
jgi:hypothetical protein